MPAIVNDAGPSLPVRSSAPTVRANGVKPAAKPSARPPVAVATDPMSQGAAAARASIAAQIAAIQAQQQQAIQEARAQAQQENLAALAGAHYLGGLAGDVYAPYKDAATTLSGLASGYSGQLQSDAQAEAQKAQAALAANGMPGTVANRAQSLGDVLYGVGGAQPGAALLNAGTAMAARAGAVPESVIGYGQDLAAGSLAAGRAASLKLAPSIAAAQAQLPALTNQYANSYASLAAKKQAMDQQAALFPLVQQEDQAKIAQQAAQTAYTNARAQGLSTSEAYTQSRIAYTNSLTGLADARKTAVETGKTGSGAKGALTESEIQTRIQGWYGGKNASIRVATLDPSTDTTTATPGYFPVPGQPGHYQKQMTALSTGAPIWHVETQPQGAVNYTTALARLTGAGVPQAQALAKLDGYYARGERGRAWLKNTEQAVLRANKLPAKATFQKEHGKVYALLTPAQVKVLRAHNMLPPGVGNADGWWLISQTKE